MMKSFVGSIEDVVTEVDVDNLVHIFDLQFDLVEVFEDVDKLLAADVIPLWPLAQINSFFPHSVVLHQVFGQLVVIAPLPDPAVHHVQCELDVVLLAFDRLEGAQYADRVGGHVWFEFGEVIGDFLVLVFLVEQLEGSVRQGL